ncbi:ribonuclease H-like [Eretmochelys imbricata]
MDTVGQEKHIWFTDGSVMVINGKKWVRYAAISLDKEVMQGQLDHRSAQQAELHAIYQALKQYEHSPQPVYIYADSDFCVKGIQFWMQDWKRNKWRAADGKDIAYLDEWKWIYQWVTENPNQLKIRHVKAHSKGTSKEAIWSSRVDTIARQQSIAVVTRSQAKSTSTEAPEPTDVTVNH